MTPSEGTDPGMACPYCLWVLDPIDGGEPSELVTCPVCGTGYHADCWADGGGCGTFGCEAWAARQDAAPPHDVTPASPVPVPGAPLPLAAPARSAPWRSATPTQAPRLAGPAAVDAASTPAVCPECGFAIAHGTRRCPSCWADIDWKDQ